MLLDECCSAEYSNRSQGLAEVCKGSSNKRSAEDVEDVEDNGEVDEGDELADEAKETFFFKLEVALAVRGSSFRYFSIS